MSPIFDAKAVRRVLLIKLRAMGDAVLTLPSLAELKRSLPQARIDVLCPPASVAVYRDDPRVGKIWAYVRGGLGLRGHFRLAQQLQDEHYELAVCLHASYRSALLGWLSGALWRSVRNHSGRDWFVTMPSTEAKEPKNIIQRDFDALRALGLQPRDLKPRMAIPASARQAALRRARALKLKKGSVLIFPGAGKLEKRWPLNRFLALGKFLKARRHSVVLMNAPGEASLRSAALTAGLVHAEISDIKELGALSRLCGYAMGNDSGPRHIAAASGAKTFTLFGPEQLREWHPYDKKDGHGALRPVSGQVEDLSVAEVQRAVALWLK